MPEFRSILAHSLYNALANTPYNQITYETVETVSRLYRLMVVLEPLPVQLVIHESEYIMARQFGNAVFSNLSLQAEDRDAFLKWSEKPETNLATCMMELLSAGFKISASWVTDQNSFCFTLVGTEATKNHKNMIMTSWSDDLEEAAQLATYKHFVMCGGEAWPTQGTGNRWG
uniref:Uncharacterized protein n=1 Tax=uncultured prokaryote TaxID=198431 RepID=A0A0H5Q3J4_9ZZZZ|nr:hypothetical protein [uncultured prokaryote]